MQHYNRRLFLAGIAIGLLGFLCPGLLKAQVIPHSPVYLQFLSRWDNDKLRTIAKSDQTFNDVWGWTDPQGREYAIFGSLDSIYFLEVTDPEHPVLRDAEAGKFNNCIHRDFKTYLHYAYAVADEGPSSLQIFDLQYLPDSVHKVYDSDSLVLKSHNIFIDNGRLYVAAHKEYVHDSLGTTIVSHPMSVYSLANPERPRLMAYMKDVVIGSQTVNYVHDVFVRNDTAYMSCGYQGLYIYDFKDPAKPKYLQSLQPPYPSNGYNHSNWLSKDGNTLVFADETWFSKLKLYDVSKIKDSMNLQEPEYISSFGSRSNEGSLPHNPFIKGNYVYISYYHEGIVVFDISHPDSPKQVAQYDTYPQNDAWGPDMPHFNNSYHGAWGVYPFFPSGTIAGIDMTNGLFLFRLDTFPEYKDSFHVEIWGNPFKDKLHFLLGLNHDMTLDIQLYDLAGRKIFSSGVNGLRGDYEYMVDTPGGLANGMYILQVIGAGEKRTFNVIKI